MKKLCLSLLAITGIISATAALAAPQAGFTAGGVAAKAFSYPLEIGIVNRSSVGVYAFVPEINVNAFINAHGAGNIWSAVNMARTVYIQDTNHTTIFSLYACPHANIDLDTVGGRMTVAISDAKMATGVKIDPNCSSRVF